MEPVTDYECYYGGYCQLPCALAYPYRELNVFFFGNSQVHLTFVLTCLFFACCLIFHRTGWGRFQLGRARQASGDLEGAVAALTKATQLGDAATNPSFDAWFALGGCLQAWKQFVAAGSAFVKAAEVGAPPGPDKLTRDLDCVHNYGLTLLADAKYEEAGLVFEQVHKARTSRYNHLYIGLCKTFSDNAICIVCTVA